jgi:hypothetical protein
MNGATHRFCIAPMMDWRKPPLIKSLGNLMHHSRTRKVSVEAQICVAATVPPRGIIAQIEVQFRRVDRAVDSEVGK